MMNYSRAVLWFKCYPGVKAKVFTAVENNKPDVAIKLVQKTDTSLSYDDADVLTDYVFDQVFT